MIYLCCDPGRRQQVLDESSLNGIDYLEVVDGEYEEILGADLDTVAALLPHGSPRQRTLLVRCLRPLPPPSGALDRDNVRVEGDADSPEVDVIWAHRASALPQQLVTDGKLHQKEHDHFTALAAADEILVVRTDRAGDFSPYCLSLVTSSVDDSPHPDFDPRLALTEFSFKIECTPDWDCKPRRDCLPEPVKAPDIDYLAKDYASFRRVMLDRMSLLAPWWDERNAADLGIALVELLAYVGDRLSYEQDAVATEAYLATCRRRVSAGRHARLVDYRVSDGTNARTWVQIGVSGDVRKGNPAAPAAIPKGARILTQVPGRDARIPANDPELNTALEQAEAVFETLESLEELYHAHGKMPFYTWGDDECCLPRKATRATLKGHYPKLQCGDVLVFEEVLGPRTGQPGDADPSRRHAVRLTYVEHADPNDGTQPLTDPVTGDSITEIRWHDDDRLPFALCISAVTDKRHSEKSIADVSVARGNVVLADHGRMIENEPLRVEADRLTPPDEPSPVPQPALSLPPLTNGNRCDVSDPEAVPARFRPVLAKRPLTHAAPYEPPDRGECEDDSDGGAAGETRPSPVRIGKLIEEARARAASSARAALHWESHTEPYRVLPQIDLTELPSTDPWDVARDLLDRDADVQAFTVEIESEGTTYLRFGDDEHGKRPEPGATFTATYRVGNGTAGNIGADTLRHIVSDHAEIVGVRNPVAARGGTDMETTEDVRQRAPIAFRTQERAVTAADYAEVTKREVHGVQKAAATYRWTGSWHTVFLTVDRMGGLRVDPNFEWSTRGQVERFRMAGYDLEVDGPRYVSLEIEMEVCVDPDHFRADVHGALLEVLSDGVRADGRLGVFHPDNFTFGQTVYLSAIYEAVQAVDGVSSVHIKTFQRQGEDDDEPLSTGKLPLGRLEIARLEDDLNYPDHGVLRLTLLGGK